MSIYLDRIEYDWASPYKLGRHVEHDSRSLLYRVQAQPGRKVQWPEVQHNGVAPILDQGNLGACTGYAAAGAVSYIENDPDQLPQSADGWNSFARGLYHAATGLDSITGTWPPDDTGSTGLAAAKALVGDELASGYLHATSGGELAAALAKGPVMCGTEWYQSMFDPDSSGQVIVDYDTPLAGGHEYVMDGFDGSHFRFRNSWGASWGDGGHFYVEQGEYLDLLFNQRGDAISLVPAVEPAPQPTPPGPEPQPAGCLPGSKLLARWRR